MKKYYFSLYEIAVLSLLGALTGVLQKSLQLPIGVPGHTGIYLVIPIIIGVAVVQKLGSGTYIGLIFGLISAFLGAGGDTSGYVVFLRYFMMGVTADLLAIPFRGHLDNIFVGIIVGAISNISKLAVMYVIDTLLGLPMGFILLGLGTACIFHVVFGGIGGAISSLVLGRLYKSGVIRKHELPAD
jgi:hypothetical protein